MTPDSSQQVPDSRKRSAVSPGPFSQKKRGKLTGPVAVGSVADAVRAVADSISGNDGLSNTPERRTRAVKVIQDDASLSVPEHISGIRLFTKNIAVADSYLALTNTEMRTEFVRSEINQFQSSSQGSSSQDPFA